MTYDQIRKYFKGITEAADQLVYTRAAIYRWRKAGVPMRAQREIELFTGGALKAAKK